MGRRKRESRVYWRERNGTRRAYADFRDFADVGGGREALIAPGETVATTDPDQAAELAAARVRELEKIRRTRTLLGVTEATLAGYAAHHLEAKTRARKVTYRHLADLEQRLRAWIEHVGDVPLDSIGVEHVERFMAALADRGLSDSTRLAYLFALSGLFTRAQAERRVLPGHNPARAMQDKPAMPAPAPDWLEVPEAALLMESARTWKSARPGIATPDLYAIVATFLLTGGRKSEVLGLDVEDISFDRRTVTFRPNAHRGLKTRTSHRTVPLWPQLESILRAHVFERDEPHPGGLLFSAAAAKFGSDHRVGEFDKQLDQIAARCGWQPGAIRSRMFRHTYASARLQTTDRGEAVSAFTVSREMGHGGLRLVERIYGHLGDVRHRADVVEYRIEQHVDALGEKLATLRAGAS